MARTPAADQVQVNFRMPVELKEQVEAAAAANNRSTTAEIVARLEASFYLDAARSERRGAVGKALVEVHNLEQELAALRTAQRTAGEDQSGTITALCHVAEARLYHARERLEAARRASRDLSGP